MFHVYLLILSLSGEPASVMQNSTEFKDEASCLAQLEQLTEGGRRFVASNPELNGKVEIVASKCISDEEIAKASAPRA